jgi:quercetin 2,3-dioxygenase
MKIRKHETRGVVQSPRTGKIISYRSFDCMSYQSPEYPDWGPIDTINDDRTEPGFITTWHSHLNLDIFGYIIKGQVHHIDNQGNDVIANEGQVQHMWCGSGIWHTEANDSNQDNRYLQIWIRPDHKSSDPPFYELVDRDLNFNKLPIDIKNSSLEVWAGNLNNPITLDNICYLLVLEGSCTVNEFKLDEGDAIDIDQPVTVQSHNNAHIILFKILK